MENSMQDKLDVFSDILQIINFMMLVKDTNNNELLKYLQHQDNDFLVNIIKQNKIIIKQNEELLVLLKGVNDREKN